MGEQSRVWTARIKCRGGHEALWAWMAFNPKLGTFATENRNHATMFKSKQEVEAWIERLKVADATPVRLHE